ncbi:MAG: 6-carboxytetrahydropterin synthase [Nitrospina sp.]|nr:6-carboxytetrahydropterin synthase [Nitrospina sp.]
MIFITKKLEFSASHRLHNPNLSEEENRETFGLCNNPNGHGHNYTIEVTVSGNVHAETGMVIDLKRLKQLVQREIIDHVDHKNLNVDVPFLDGVIPTAENLAIKIWDILEPLIQGGSLYQIKLYESDRNFVIYRGEYCEGLD